MKKTLSLLALSLFASLAAACSSAPVEEAAFDAKVEAAAAVDSSQAGARAETGSDDLTCPAAGTCAKADTYCDGDPDNSWCQILDRCHECYGLAVDDTSARAETGSDDLTCPAAGTCAKADAYCDGDPDNSWCQILDRCFECGIGLAPESTSARAETGSDDLTCPGAGTCTKADQYCDGDPDNSWCQILDRCFECYGGFATAAE